MTRINYPEWICQSCGTGYGRFPEGHIAAFHIGSACGWCGRADVSVTEPRDFGYPPAPVRNFTKS